MENINITDNAEFSEEIRKLKTTDPAHADTLNALFERLLNNDIFLNRLADTMVKKASIIHDATEEDPEKVPGADVTAGLQKQLNEYNTKLDDTSDMMNKIVKTKSYLTLNVTDESYVNIFKNASETNDYGTVIQDFDRSKTETKLVLNKGILILQKIVNGVKTEKIIASL